MNALVLLMALLGVSFLGGFIGENRSVRGIGLPSGLEWVALGLLLSPSVLGVIDSSLQQEVEPLALVAIGWLALVLGVDFGVVRRRRLRSSRIALGVVIGTVMLVVVSGALWLGLPRLAVGEHYTMGDRLLMALGLGAVLIETTSHGVHWVADRYGAHGPVFDLLADVAEAKDAVPIVAVGVVLCVQPTIPYPWPLPAITLTAIVIVAGVLLGLVALVLLGRSPSREQAWGVLLGASVLGIGVAARLGLPAVTLLFAMGLVLGLLSRYRDELTAMIDVTRRPALLPALILIGARLDPMLAWRVAPLLGIALGARVFASALSGLPLALALPSRPSGPLLGLATLSAGELSLGLGLVLAMRFHDERGGILLAAAACSALLGEIIGPVALRRAMRTSGEIENGGAAPGASR